MARKILTFSYDDGVGQDIRLAELFHKYGMKATFNLNSALLGKSGSLVRDGATVSHNRVNADDVKSIYAGHEIAAHTLTHPRLTALDDAAVIREVEEDRLKLSELAGYEVVGFAYPGGGVNYDTRVAEIIRANTGIKYCRTTVSTHSFTRPANLYELCPSVYHHREWDELFRLGERLLSSESDSDEILYVWGHAYEFDIADTWARFDEFLSMMSGKPGIEYLTNKEALIGD
jgi:peptidoglycan/xylan/chitin deacetylase (PgdA/CDA1 family)